MDVSEEVTDAFSDAVLKLLWDGVYNEACCLFHRVFGWCSK